MSDDARTTARIAALHAAAAERILVLDGSWGAKIQELSLTEEDFRGERFTEHASSLRGDTDLLCLTAPQIVTRLADEYLAAGADMITTNTFTATSIAQADYDMQAHVVEINLAVGGDQEHVRRCRETVDAAGASLRRALAAES